MPELRSILRDYERQPVPQAVRKPWWTMALVNAAVAVNVAALLFGGHLAAGVTAEGDLTSDYTGECLRRGNPA